MMRIYSLASIRSVAIAAGIPYIRLLRAAKKVGIKSFETEEDLVCVFGEMMRDRVCSFAALAKLIGGTHTLGDLALMDFHLAGRKK